MDVVDAPTVEAPCRSGTQSQMTPALVLAGLAVLLLLFWSWVIDYMQTGEGPQRKAGAPIS